jgi:hypothetical protein
MIPSVILIALAVYFGIEALIDTLIFYSTGVRPVHAFYPFFAIFLVIISVQLISFALLIDYFSKKLNRIEEKIK